MRKGIVFSLDAVLTLLVLLMLVPLSSFFRLETTPSPVFQSSLYFQAQDAIDSLSRVRISDVRSNPAVQSIFDQGLLTDEELNASVLDAIGGLWAMNTTISRSAATNLTRAMLDGLMPQSVQWGFAAEVPGGEDLLYNTSQMPSDARVVFKSTRYASGFQINQPSRGYVARAVLDAIKGKQSASYAYFGGFVGQGNVTAAIDGVPDDADVKWIYVEADLGSNATVFVNGVQCGTLNVSRDPIFQAANATYTGAGCLSAVVKGAANTVFLNFSGSDDLVKYVGGGYASITYSTQKFADTSENRTLYRFPGIRGLVNLYDSFYVPGNVTNASAYVHINTSYQFYLQIGNATVINSSGASGEQMIFIDNATFAANISKAFYGGGSTLNPLDATNVPVRLGLANIPLNQAADISLSIDVSGSMATCVGASGITPTKNENFTVDNGILYCGAVSYATCVLPDFETRVQGAVNASKSFIDHIITRSINRLGIAEFTAASSRNNFGSPPAGFYNFIPTGIWPWMSKNYPYRVHLEILNNNLTRQIPAGTPVNFSFNHSRLAIQGKSNASGYDVRVAWFNTSLGTYVMLERFNTTKFNDPAAQTTVWFPLQQNVSAGSVDYNYFVYYGNMTATNPPDDPRRIFLLYDDFSDGDYANFTNWTARVNSTVWNVTSGNLTVNGSNYKATIFAGDPSWSDYAVEADAWFGPVNNNQTASVLLYFNSTMTGGYETTMMGAALDDYRNYWWNGLNGSQASYGKFVQLSSSNLANIANNRWYHFKTGIYEKYLRSFLDGTLYNTNFNSSYSSGLIGLGAGGGTGANNAFVRFRKVFVRKWIYPDPTTTVNKEEAFSGGGTTMLTLGILNNASANVFKPVNNTFSYANGTEIGNNTAVPFIPFDSASASIDWNYTPGVTIVNATTDYPPAPNGEFSESNESNNISARIVFKPDLRVDWVAITPFAPVAGAVNTFTLNALVINQGPVDASNIVVRFTKASGENSGTWGETTVSLASGQSAMAALVVAKTFAVVGQHNLTATADPDGVIDESYETNNAGYGSIWVAGKGSDYFGGVADNYTGRGTAGTLYYTPANVCGGPTTTIFGNGKARSLNLTSNTRSLKDFLASSKPWLNTCICCGVNASVELLRSNNAVQRTRSLILMTDGQPNVDCPGMPGSTGNPVRDSIVSACNAYNNYSIRVYTIGFGTQTGGEVNWTLLKAMADCGGGANYSGANSSELEIAFQKIIEQILNQTQIQQAINVSGDYITTNLFPDSYIDVNYTYNRPPPAFKEITLPIETDRFGSCMGTYYVPTGLTPYDVRVTSYSGSLWTAKVSVNSSTSVPWSDTFKLSKWGQRFDNLGDPFAIHYPSYLVPFNENNSVNVSLGLNASAGSQMCSNSSRVIYDARVKGSVGYGNVFINASGFNLTVYYDANHDGVADGFSYVAVGQDLTQFNATAINVSALDTARNALADAVARLLVELNFFNPGSNPNPAGSQQNPIDIQLSDSIAIQSNDLGGVPFMWGPNAFSVRVWGK